MQGVVVDCTCTIDKEKTGKAISNLMKENGYTIFSLAEKMMLSRRTVEDWRSGRNVPSIDNLVYLSELFNVGIDQIVIRRVIR